jgi:hypothetical protein
MQKSKKLVRGQQTAEQLAAGLADYPGGLPAIFKMRGSADLRLVPRETLQTEEVRN